LAPKPADDIRDQLRTDHEVALAELDALRLETDERQAHSRLRELRQLWMVHALAEETVVYRALESGDLRGDARARSDERFVEHELVGNLFDQLSRNRPGTLEWSARLNVVRDLIRRHIETEHAEMFAQLEGRFDPEGLCAMGRRFRLAYDKLTMLEQAKAA
jgi:hypothetical protein